MTAFNRISLLPITRYCAEAGRLASQHGAGRAARMSQAFHARLAHGPDSTEARTLYGNLYPGELEELQKWSAPTTAHLEEGVVLDYASAEKELPVGLTRGGSWCPYEDGASWPGFLTRGTLDFGWVREWGGERIAFVGDLKKSDYTTRDGTDSLQLHAYATAYADMRECDAYVVGLWILDEGFWRWQEEPPIELGSRRHIAIFEQIVHAAQNTESEASTGAHCNGCWSRRYCKEWLAPEMLALEALNLPELTSESALDVMLKKKALEDAADILDGALKSFVRDGGRILDGKGKEWAPSLAQGRESVKVDTVRQLMAELGPEHELTERLGRLITRGAKYERFGWVKERNK